MKYIRVFEGFRDEYYQKVDDNESPLLDVNKFGDYEWVDLSRRVIDYLKSEIMYGWDISDSSYRDVGFVTLSMRVYRSRKIVTALTFIILESSDDWFWVKLTDYDSITGLNQTNQTYKCDQFDGLVQLLKDKGVIKNEGFI